MIPNLDNTEITIRRATIAQDANGQPAETWADYLTFRGHLYQASVSQRFASSKTTDFFTHRMLCPVVDITSSDKVVADGFTHKVVSVNRGPFSPQLTVDLERIS